MAPVLYGLLPPSKLASFHDHRSFRNHRSFKYSSSVLAVCWAIVVNGATVVVADQRPSVPSSSIAGQVVDAQGHGINAALVSLQMLPSGPIVTHVTEETGAFRFTGLSAGVYEIAISKPGFPAVTRDVRLGEQDGRELVLTLHLLRSADSVTVVGSPDDHSEFNGLARMEDVEGTALFSGKKSEVLVLSRLNANLASGNTRQVFGKVPGVNIWENDGSGLQIGVSNRGLDPNRSWEMNSRQNGYDITADIYGYPEAYFTPPLDAVERIEVVRGAASLQYGAQFGGLVNYVLKEAPPNRRFAFTTEQTAGSGGAFVSHNRIGGRIGAWSYNGYYHRRQADGWRPNAGFDSDTAFGSLKYAPNDRVRLAFEFTGSHYLMQMAGGLTDALFNQDARTSIRPRNWFDLTWLLPSLKVDYSIDASTIVSVNVYAIRGQRYALFNSEPVAFASGALNFDDPTKPRTLYRDRFHNLGVEVRALRQYQWHGRSHTLAAGIRAYRGKTVRQHGIGQTGSEADFDWLVEDVTRNLHFKSINLAGFAENTFRLTTRFNVTPGVRVDHIRSTGEGRPIVGTQKRERDIPLVGVGVAYRLTDSTSLYGNISQAYRPTLFNDLWRPDPAIVVDPQIKDMAGYVTEYGWRGNHAGWLSFDVGGFYLRYGDRIGLLTRQDPTAQTISLWTNVSDSRNIGLESFVEADLVHLVRGEAGNDSLYVFSSLAAISARYLQGMVKGHRVELAPKVIARTGVTYRRGPLAATLQHNQVGDQFTDANNTLFTVDAVQGLIPAYDVWDLSGSYRFQKHYVVRLGINNVADARYFTRRAASYPGPGLLPADGRRLNVAVGLEY